MICQQILKVNVFNYFPIVMADLNLLNKLKGNTYENLNIYIVCHFFYLTVICL
ncbi:hypothetical protein PRUB_b0689 [Pseudoalteromonas rubra]|uniref:Uncharacterized protein n=1 Tax=Pseudoalteromonas rubra TaxID=43658 RepID=A0A8T0C016_9GAMM|nr:hypothetical protein PRUB_b0689 [Pseudoalteromonas rubra]